MTINFSAEGRYLKVTVDGEIIPKYDLLEDRQPNYTVTNGGTKILIVFPDGRIFRNLLPSEFQFEAVPFTGSVAQLQTKLTDYFTFNPGDGGGNSQLNDAELIIVRQLIQSFTQ